MQFGVQLTAFLFLITIIFNYFRHKRLPLQSTAFFTCFLIASLINLASEGFSLYTINNLENIPSLLNRFAHQLFIGSLNFVILMLYLYIDLKCHNQAKYTKKELIIRLVPFVITLIIILFGELNYNTESSVRYSYGLMAYTVYACAALYIILSIISLIRFHKRFTLQELITIFLGIASWSIVSIVQYFIPTLLMSSLAIVLMVQFLYMSFENTDKYLTMKDGCVFSKNAFELTLNEYLLNKNYFYVININILNYDLLATKLGYEAAYSLINDYASTISKEIKGTVFLTKDNTISLVLDHVEEYNEILSVKTETIEYSYNNDPYKLKVLRKGVKAYRNTKADDVIKELETNDDIITVTKDNKTYQLQIKDIYYVEVIDNQSFIYTKKDCYEVKDKLYKLEEILLPWNFIRCSKSMLCNISKIVSISKEPNSRLLVYLNNEETIIVTRQYIKDFKLKTKL